VSVDLTEILGSVTFGDASTDTIVWTFDRATGTDPTITFNSGSIGLQALTLTTVLAEASGGTGQATFLAAVNAITGAIDLGGASSLEVPNGANPTTDAFGEIAADSDAQGAGRGSLEFFDGTSSTFMVGILATDTCTNLQVPKWNTGGTWTCENDDNAGAATEFDDIADPSGNGVVALAGTTHAWTSTLDSGIMWSFTNTDADSAADTTFLKLLHNDGGDANVIYIDFVNDADGTPTSIFKVSQTSAVFTVDVTVPTEAYDATGWNGDLAAPTKDAVRDAIEALTPFTDPNVDCLLEFDDSGGVIECVENATFLAALAALTGDLDIGALSVVELPNAAAPTVNAFAEIAGDNNLWDTGRGALLFYDGTASTALIGVLTSDTPSNGQVPKWNTGGTITWEDDNSGGGGGSFDILGSDVVAVGGGDSWQDVTGLAHAVSASTTYYFTCTFNIDIANASPIYIGLTGPASPTRLRAVAGYSESDGGAWRSGVIQAYDTFSTFAAADGSDRPATLSGVFVNGSNAGTLQVRMYGNSTSAQTFRAGSHCEWQ
jgi:hypothetical protein